jgi:putative exporter of polyketide antibiotics
MTGMMPLMLSLAVLASILLIGAGLNILVRKTDAPKRGWLMLGAGLVTLVNVWLYASVPPQL